MMMEFAGMSRDVADPWYTGDFEQTYQDVLAGCTGLLELLERK
jgi:protein-tyrosine phosphatase